VIFTPGHTPGHICLYLKKSKTLIAGDALMLVDGKLISSPPELTADPVQAKESLKKLAELDVEPVICYHGGVYQGGIKGLLGD
jgi:glyoxylase-like metal-dependent hydrolase (beta-lactamase superfamily II)